MTDLSSTTGAGGGTTTDTSNAADARATLQRTVQELREEVTREVGARSQQVRDWASQQADTARTTVVEKPFASAGAAFAAGVILGVLLARR